MFGFVFTKGILKYAVMPEIMPRLRSLLFGGFGYVPFFIAVVYQMVGLLPRNHPYLMQSNIGRYGVRHVIAQAASNVTFSVKNIDQIVLFVAVLAGMVMFIIQVFAMGSVFFLQPAVALPTNWAGFFTITDVNYRSQDLAYMMLDMVFGVPSPGIASSGFFESCIGTSVVCNDSSGVAIASMSTTGLSPFTSTMAAQISPLAPGADAYFPFPFHVGLHKLFAVYSTGLLVIAVMMTSYFVATILGETAQTGTPFGKRFNKTWAPLRIVIAFGLLVPLTVGLNSAQYLVLYSAKYGSAFASNGWRYFNDTLTTSYLGSGQSMVSTPNVPELNDITHFMFVARTCKYVYDYYHLKQLGNDAVAEGKSVPSTLTTDQEVQAYILLEDTATTNSVRITSSTSYSSVIADLPKNTVRVKVRIGVKDDDKYEDSHSGVKSICGDMLIPLVDGREYAKQEEYLRDIQEAYFNLVRDLWLDTMWLGVDGGTSYPAFSATQNHRYKYIAGRKVAGILQGITPDPKTGADPNHNVDLNSGYVQNINDKAQKEIKTVLSASLSKAVSSSFWGGPSSVLTANLDPLYSRGWAGAGIWYNRLAQVNGQLTGAVFGVPMVLSYPSIMETVASKKAMYSNMLSATDRYKPEAPAVGDIGLLLDQAVGLEFSTVLYEAYSSWQTAVGVSSRRPSGNPILAFISYLLGLDGLYDMRNNQANNTHPLAQLAGVGKALVESSIRSLGYAAGVTLFGAAMQGAPRKLAYVMAHFFVTMAMLGLTVGFVLFYVLPFLPFIYFFFAVGGWVKGIFEAMVGAPLWALAHIRIDGHGMPGNAALNGYFLIFEVFLRPILIVFGMLASITIYAALVKVLNEIFSLVTENTAGYDIESEMLSPRMTLRYMRSLIDEFFFTVIYAIIVYMLGMSAFKLVDTLPNNILRWMGQSVASFGDQREDPAQGLVGRASMGSQQVLGKIGGGIGGIVNAAAGGDGK